MALTVSPQDAERSYYLYRVRRLYDDRVVVLKAPEHPRPSYMTRTGDIGTIPRVVFGTSPTRAGRYPQKTEKRADEM